MKFISIETDKKIERNYKVSQERPKKTLHELCVRFVTTGTIVLLLASVSYLYSLFDSKYFALGDRSLLFGGLLLLNGIVYGIKAETNEGELWSRKLLLLNFWLLSLGVLLMIGSTVAQSVSADLFYEKLYQSGIVLSSFGIMAFVLNYWKSKKING